MNDDILQQLLEACRLDQNITWVSERTDNELKLYIKNGIAKIKRNTGLDDADFLPGQKGCDLLLGYVRRARSGDTAQFNNDFSDDIYALYIENEAAYGEEL